MDWKSVEASDDGKVEFPNNWLLPHYYEAFTVLFRVENALRLFVYVILKEQFGPKWQDLEITTDEDKKTTIAALAKRRIEQGKEFGYLSYPIQSPLMHLTSGELVALMTHNSYWPAFKEYFPAAKSVVTLKLQEIGIIRNALAHFRPLSGNDVEVARQNANQMLSRVEQTIVGLIECRQIVPTNNSEEWYANMRTLGTDLVSLSFSQSSEGSWVRIRLGQTIVTTGGNPDPERDWQYYSVAYLDTPAMLEVSPVLRDKTLLLTENVRRFGLGKDLRPTGYKEACLTFSHRVLADAHVELKLALEEILTLITQETDLLREDQLAKGKLVKLAGFISRLERDRESARWSSNYNLLRSRPPAKELAEYWGDVSAGRDFISDTESYPWMPVTVSESAVPF